MKRILVATVLTLFAVPLALGQTSGKRSSQNMNQSSSVEQDLRKLEQEWNGAEVSKDRKFFERTLAPNFIHTGRRGMVRNKQQFMELIMEPGDGTEIISMDEVKVYVYGDAAVLNGRNTAKDRNNNVTSQWRFTDVFVRRSGRWQVVASHSSGIEQER